MKRGNGRRSLPRQPPRGGRQPPDLFRSFPLRHRPRRTIHSIHFLLHHRLRLLRLRESFDQDSSSADELFFDGKILPIEIKKRLAPPRTAVASPPLPPQGTQRPVEIKATNTDTEEKQINQKSSSSSFWRFKRSSSLNCGSGYARTLCPLPLLSRSNSTGSTASSKRSSLPNNQKQNLLKYSSPNSSLKQPPSSCHRSRL
ncbi:UNVERIFIED_CONTAM: hypothetical protein Sradi_3111800 [Sesamum radiatum]|uniref:Uncharacterized protein n=1 Tax=Sesamum radiatum TaxID=300843 RepID=A0AAW2RFA1_SESRA